MSVVWGIIFLCAGGYGVYWTGKRSFERRNACLSNTRRSRRRKEK